MYAIGMVMLLPCLVNAKEGKSSGPIGIPARQGNVGESLPHDKANFVTCDGRYHGKRTKARTEFPEVVGQMTATGLRFTEVPTTTEHDDIISVSSPISPEHAGSKTFPLVLDGKEVNLQNSEHKQFPPPPPTGHKGAYQNVGHKGTYKKSVSTPDSPVLTPLHDDMSANSADTLLD